jgi:hypothetical protein
MRPSTSVTTQAAWGKTSPHSEKALSARRGGLVSVVAPGDDLEEEVGVLSSVAGAPAAKPIQK